MSNTSSSDQIGIENVQGDISAGKVEGIGNIAGKEVNVTIQGHVFNLGSNFKETVKEIISSPASVPKVNETHTASAKKIEQSKITERKIEELVSFLEETEKESGIKSKRITAGEYHVDTDYLLIKKFVLEGNKHFFRRDYNKAIEYYDKSIEIDPYYADAWYNKGSALEEQGDNLQALKCYDNAIDIEPEYVNALYAKGNLLYKKTSKQKTIISILVTVLISASTLFFFPFIDAYHGYPGLVMLLVIIGASIGFFYFWNKEGFWYYRRLNKSTKRKILFCVIIFIAAIWCGYVYTSYMVKNLELYVTRTSESISFPVDLGTYEELALMLGLSGICISANFIMFLYNSVNRGEHYINKAKELGKII